MPRVLAFTLCCGLVFWLFRQDMRLRRLPSRSLWIPAVWVGLLGSRPVSYWLGWLGINAGPVSRQEGSTLDLVVMLSLIVLAVLALRRRQFSWSRFIWENKTLILIYAYLALSATWAADSLPTFKRVVKDFGNVPVALVLLTGPLPLEGIRVVFARVSYVLLPFSLIFTKYFPEIGHLRSRGGEHLFTGVAQHKNTLGLMLFVLGLVLVIDLMELRKTKRTTLHQWIRVGMLILTVWLLLLADSVTAQVCLALGCVMLSATGWMLRRAHLAGRFSLLLGVVFGLAIVEQVFGVSGVFLESLGRDATLTGRVDIWAKTREHAGSLLGVGFYSFWDTPFGRQISEAYDSTLSTVHNGFLEMLLDGGVIGLVLLVVLLLAWGRSAFSAMLARTLFGRFKLVMWVLALVYNNSETSFFRMEPLWFTSLLTMAAVPEAPVASAASAKRAPAPTVSPAARVNSYRRYDSPAEKQV